MSVAGGLGPGLGLDTYMYWKPKATVRRNPLRATPAMWYCLAAYIGRICVVGEECCTV